MRKLVSPEWAVYLQRYTNGEWRAPIFRDMILFDVHRVASKQSYGVSLLDIGCGTGFDNDSQLQQSIAKSATSYMGVEPDMDIALCDIFSVVHRCCFEAAPIAPNSVDVAFSVMVLEHVECPATFWNKVYEVLSPKGVFWGFTVDARNWFVSASLLADKIRIKNTYLNLLHGRPGEERYENYKVFYKSNTPQQIEAMTMAFTSRTILNFNRVGQLDFYMPRHLRWLSRAYERVSMQMGWPGSIMAIRLEK